MYIIRIVLVIYIIVITIPIFILLKWKGDIEYYDTGWLSISNIEYVPKIPKSKP